MRCFLQLLERHPARPGSCSLLELLLAPLSPAMPTDEKDSGKLLTQGRCRSNKNSLDVLSMSYGATRTA